MLATLTTLSLTPDPPVPDAPLADKATHVLAYGGTTLVLLLAAVWRPGRGDGPFRTGTAIVAFGLLALGVGLEVVQGLEIFGPRTAEPADAVANGIGVVAGVAVWWLVRSRTRPRVSV